MDKGKQAITTNYLLGFQETKDSAGLRTYIDKNQKMLKDLELLDLANNILKQITKA